MGRLIGYARVSTAEQDLQLQLDALDKAGCDEVFTDKASGASTKRPGLDACVAALKPGDTLVVWRLDRLGRSMPHLVGLVEELLGKGIGFRSLLDGAIDTTTAAGELMLHVLSQLFAPMVVTGRIEETLKEILLRMSCKTLLSGKVRSTVALAVRDHASEERPTRATLPSTPVAQSGQVRA